MPKVMKHYLRLLKDNSFNYLDNNYININDYNIITERYILFFQIIGHVLEGLFEFLLLLLFFFFLKKLLIMLF